MRRILLLGVLWGCSETSHTPSFDPDRSLGGAGTSSTPAGAGGRTGAPDAGMGGAVGGSGAGADAGNEAGTDQGEEAGQAGTVAGVGGRAGGGGGARGGSAGDTQEGSAGEGGVEQPIPCFGPIVQDGDFEWDLPVVRVEGSITLGGGALPDSPGATTRGAVTFTDLDTYSVYTFDVGNVGTASFSGLVFGGTYDVRFTTGDEPLEELPSSATKMLAQGVVVDASSNRTYDLRTSRVTGFVTQDGLPLADGVSGRNRGSVVFSDEASGGSYHFDVGDGGPGVYAGLVFDGDYAVSFGTTPEPPAGLPPLGRGRLANHVQVATDSTLDYDLRTVVVGGTLTRNGAVVPNSTILRGSVSFTDLATGATYSFGVGAAGDATFSGLLFQGDYEIGFTTANSWISGLPTGMGVRLDQERSLREDASLLYDFRTADVSMTFTTNGTPMSDAAQGASTRGEVRIENDTGSAVWHLTPSGAATVSRTLFVLDYEAVFITYTTPGLAVGNYARRLLGKALRFEQDTSVTYDLAEVAMYGAVTLAGAPLPQGVDLGTLHFFDKNSGDHRRVSLSTDGTYFATLFHGIYDVAYQPGASHVAGLPTVGLTLARDVPLMGTRILDFDLEPNELTLSGTLTRNGAPVPDSPLATSRGRLSFPAKNAGIHFDYSVNVPATGAATFSTPISPGAYDVLFASSADQLVGLPSGVSTYLTRGCEPAH